MNGATYISYVAFLFGSVTQESIMIRRLVLTTIVAVCFGMTAVGVDGAEKTRFGVDVSEWSSDTVATSTVLPVGGSGQVNGNFVRADRNGVEIGLRAQRRFSQNIDPLVNFRDKKVAVYLADTGTSDGLGRATWNYDIHVDLRGAFGVAKGKTLDNYTLMLDTDIGATLFDFPVPIDIGVDFMLPPEVVLFQTSLNPKFGNAPFDANAEGTYNFTLILTPKTFNGPPIVADMSVVVMD
jgi:hypothetical protein